MKHVFRALLAGAACIPTVIHAQTVQDTQIWGTVTASGTITGDYVFALEAQARAVDDVSRHGQTLLRGSIGVAATPDLTLSVGFVHSEVFRAAARDEIENRSFQQAVWVIGPALGGTVSTRARLEQRWFKGTDDTGWRYRQTLRLNKPVGTSGLAVIVQSEIFFNLNSTDAGARAGFDQLRGLVGISVPLTPAISIDAGYQPIYVNGAMRDRLNHTFPVTLAIKL